MKHKKVAFLFAGQGSQKVGMGYDFYQSYDEAKDIFDKLDESIKQACFFGPAEVLEDTRMAQQALLGFSLALTKILSNHKIKASMVAGLSLGEYSALTYAGVFSVDDALEVVSKRAQIMSEALSDQDTTMMAVLNAPLEKVKEANDKFKDQGVCEIANINAPTQIVISGHRALLNHVKEFLTQEKGVRVLPLKVSGAFHCSLLEDASIQLETVLNKVKISQPTIPVVFNTTGKVSDHDIKPLLVSQIKSTVLFVDSIETMINAGVDCFIEISPKSTLCGLVKKINSDVDCYCVSDQKSLISVLEEV